MEKGTFTADCDYCDCETTFDWAECEPTDITQWADCQTCEMGQAYIGPGV